MRGPLSRMGRLRPARGGQACRQAHPVALATAAGATTRTATTFLFLVQALRKLSELGRVAAEVGRALAARHRHGPTTVVARRAPFPVVCVGSSTQAPWSFNEYTIDGPHCGHRGKGIRPRDARVCRGRAFELKLRR